MTEVKVQTKYKDTIFRMIFKQKEDLFSTKQIMLPTPRFVVFYNGSTPQPERQMLKLSDAFQKR